MNTPLVSIIIPTYNRAHLIGETLDSVLAQTYTNWECIVVDDGSTDNTEHLLNEYCNKDARFQYHHRPKDRPKGANACRNYGFELSKGEYINWFDSDDLMVSNHLNLKIEEITRNKVDYVIAQTVNFKNNEFQEPYKYIKQPYGITAEDYILRKIHWYTYDVMLSRMLAIQISYNEQIKSWQDYNYFCKMVLISTKGNYIEEILTHRRLHETSIQQNMTKTSANFYKELLEAKILTYLDIKHKLTTFVKIEYLFGLMNNCYYLTLEKESSNYKRQVSKEIVDTFGYKSLFWFKVSLLSARLFKKGEFLLNFSKNK